MLFCAIIKILMEKITGKDLDVCFIRPREKNDYYFDGIKMMDLNIEMPYRDYGNMILRILREIHFRLHLPYRSIWFSKKILNIKNHTIIVEDPLITVEFMDWLRKVHPDKRIIMNFENRVNKYTLNPNDLDKSIETWTFDEGDMNKYHMGRTYISYLDVYRMNHKENKEYDVVFLGCDKGRGEELLELQKKMEEAGLKTFFRICADRRFMRFNKRYYGPRITYKDYIELCSKSRSILNYVKSRNTGITLRDHEVLFNQVKGITNNLNTTNFEFYDPSRYFILGKDDFKDLKKFLDEPFKPVDEEYLESIRFLNVLKKGIE